MKENQKFTLVGKTGNFGLYIFTAIDNLYCCFLGDFNAIPVIRLCFKCLDIATKPR